MTLLEGMVPVAEFEGVALGAAGAGRKQKRGDNITPIGCYRVVSVRSSRKFLLFLQLDYPSLADAERGLENQVINRAAYERICQAHAQGRMPPQDTLLGGDIGIHGVGRGSLEIHRIANWTGGCLALDNDQIRKLGQLIRPGVIVEIQ